MMKKYTEEKRKMMKDSKENKVKLDRNKWKVTKNVILKKRRKEMKKH
jgi:hypothetical protein